MAKRKQNYLNNKDMLKEIHLSKITYCTFLDPVEDNQQDFIVEDVNDITGKIVKEAREARATRLNKLHGNTDLAPKDINIEDIVFRVMTTEHIPLVPKKKAKKRLAAKKKPAINAIFNELLEEEPDSTAEQEQVWAELEGVEMIPMRCGFPAFFHYRVKTERDDTKRLWVRPKNLKAKYQPYIVGKSHWKGDFETGGFCKEHGATTGNLALMYMKLCERYATRSNWRGYTYNDEMQGQALLQLSQIGLQFNELKSQNPFAYYTAAVTNSFTRVLNIEKKMQNIRDDILEDNGLTPSWTRQFLNEHSNDAEIEPAPVRNIK